MSWVPIEVSSIATEIEVDEDDRAPIWLVELRDLARGLCGGLIVALPLLYTMEMWQRARMMPAIELIGVLLAAYLINVGANYFCGFKSQQRRVQPWLDSITALGIGAVAALVTLLLVGRLDAGMPLAVVVNLISLELIPVSLGASLAMNQLGGRGGCSDEVPEFMGPDTRKLLATVIGAILFAFNVAPTIEPKVIMTTITWWHVIGIAAFSLFISWLMVEFARFGGNEPRKGSVFDEVWLETVLSYLVSLLVGACLLWMFGYIGLHTPLSTMIPWIVVIGYATTLGGSAGRLIL